MSDPQLILRTKLHSPPTPRDYVPRPDLYARLDDGLKCPIILLTAPAGFGKSTLLSAWLAQINLPSAWLSLDAGDNDLSLFLSYVVAAVRRVFPDACAEIAEMIRQASLPSVEYLAHQLINNLDTLPSEFVLVLDDYDVIRDFAITELMAVLVRRPPQSLHLVIAARQDPVLPLARLRAQGQMTGLRSADLRFGRGEMVEFLRNIPELVFDDADLALLEKAVEGWPAGLRLAAINLRLSDDPAATLAALELNNTFAAEYLFSEILAKLPEDQQAKLLKLAIVDRFCAGVCEALCEPPTDDPSWQGGNNFLQWLQSSNIFLVALDSEGVWFRFHHLFLQMLRDRMHAACSANERAGLRRNAATWLAAAGYTEDALRLFLQAGDLDAAAGVVGTARMHVISQEDWPRLARWLDLFPAEYAGRSPELQIIRAFVLNSLFRLQEIEQILDRIEATAETAGGKEHPAATGILAVEIATLRAQNLFWAGDSAGSLKCAQYVFAHAPADYLGVIGAAYLYLGLSLQTNGDQANALSWITQALAGNDARQYPQLAARMLLAQTVILWASADLGATERSARQLLRVTTQHHLRASQGWAYFILGCVCYWRNQLPEAAAHFGALVERPFGAHFMAAIHAHFGLAITLLAQGHSAHAAEVLETAFAYAAEAGGLIQMHHVKSFEAHLSLLGGRKAAAFAWADRNQEIKPGLPMYYLEIPELTWIQVRIAQGANASRAQLTAALAEVRRHVDATHNVLRRIDALALEALLYAANHEAAAALAALQEALALAEPGAIVRPFVDLGSPMAALLREAAQQPALGSFAAQVLAAFSGKGAEGAAWSATGAAGDGKALEPLTNRELEVLALLGQRLSNKEIAQILVVSPVTVKAHARNLFAKLNANSRREAVARAYSLGLLRPS